MTKIVKRKLIEGFSLIELSVVLAIIGLLAGGIFAGQSLLKSAKLSKVSSTMNSLRSAYNSFLQQYGYAPGDFPTATQVWGRADNGSPITSNCAAPSTDNANSSGTCNGNGDGLTTGSEPARAWQQLKLAGYIQGNYNGVSAYPRVPGVTFPTVSDFSTTGMISTEIASPQFNAMPTDERANLLAYQTYQTTMSMNGGGPVLTPEDAYSIDRKMDDGYASRGRIRGAEGYWPWNTTNTCMSGGDYDLSRSGDQCALIMLNPEASKTSAN